MKPKKHHKQQSQKPFLSTSSPTKLDQSTLVRRRRNRIGNNERKKQKDWPKKKDGCWHKKKTSFLGFLFRVSFIFLLYINTGWGFSDLLAKRITQVTKYKKKLHQTQNEMAYIVTDSSCGFWIGFKGSLHTWICYDIYKSPSRWSTWGGGAVG